MANTLFLRLEGPFQSWGERARWSVRDTAPEPTKSGVVGLLGCALGLNKDEDLRNLNGAIRIGVRCERPGNMLVDFHTVVGGVLSAEGKVKKTASTRKPETVISFRSYLCDASFLAAVLASPEWIACLAAGARCFAFDPRLLAVRRLVRALEARFRARGYRTSSALESHDLCLSRGLERRSACSRQPSAHHCRK